MMTAEEILDLSREGNLSLTGLSDGELVELLPQAQAAIQVSAENAAHCDERIKDFQASKKSWQETAEGITKALQEALEHNGRKNLIASDGTSAVISTRNILEADEGAILAPWREVIEALKASLPDYIQIKESVNKVALARAAKDDPMIIANNPEAIHYRESTSLSIKPAKEKQAQKRDEAA